MLSSMGLRSNFRSGLFMMVANIDNCKRILKNQLFNVANSPNKAKDKGKICTKMTCFLWWNSNSFHISMLFVCIEGDKASPYILWKHKAKAQNAYLHSQKTTSSNPLFSTQISSWTSPWTFCVSSSVRSIFRANLGKYSTNVSQYESKK
jgi:hypothetical protein